MRKATADKKIEATLLYLQRRQREKDEYEDKTLLSILSYQHIFFSFVILIRIRSKIGRR